MNQLIYKKNIFECSSMGNSATLRPLEENYSIEQQAFTFFPPTKFLNGVAMNSPSHFRESVLFKETVQINDS